MHLLLKCSTFFSHMPPPACDFNCSKNCSRLVQLIKNVNAIVVINFDFNDYVVRHVWLQFFYEMRNFPWTKFMRKIFQFLPLFPHLDLKFTESINP